MQQREFNGSAMRSRQRGVDGTPMASFSYNILFPNKRIDIGPMACLRTPGHLHNTAKSAVRALDVIELLARHGSPMRAFEIARSIGLSPSSADQLLKTLVDTAYLLFDPCSKEYHLSPRTSQIGVAMKRSFFDGEYVDAIMSEILRKTKRSITLLAPAGQFMQIVDFREEVESAHPLLPIGTRVPMFGSGSGAAWLAQQPDDHIRTLITRCQRELGPLANDQDLILESIYRVREQGFAVGGFQVPERDTVCGGVAISLPPSGSGITLVITAVLYDDDIASEQEKVACELKSAIAEYTNCSSRSPRDLA